MLKTLQKTYRYRIEPDATQTALLYQFSGARRFIWNWALAERQAAYQASKQTLSVAALCQRLTALKQQPETAWLRQCDSQLLQQAIRDVHQAFANFFARRARFPRFKSKKRDTLRFRIPQRVVVQDGYVVIPKIGRVKLRYHRELHGSTKSATFKRDATGHWYVTFVVEVHVLDVKPPVPPLMETVGVDVGLKDAAVLSTGERIAAPKWYGRAERKLKRAQRALSRKANGSQNRAKARLRLAGIHQQTANKRTDFLHKLSHRLVTTFRDASRASVSRDLCKVNAALTAWCW